MARLEESKAWSFALITIYWVSFPTKIEFFSIKYPIVDYRSNILWADDQAIILIKLFLNLQIRELYFSVQREKRGFHSRAFPGGSINWHAMEPTRYNYIDQSPAILTSDNFMRSNEIIWTKWQNYLSSNWPFCYNNLIISSEHKNSRWST